MRLAHFTVAAAAVILIAGPASAQNDSWSWNKVIASGRTLEIKGINGDISATAASGGEVQVIAKKSGRRSQPSSVRLVAVEHAGGVTICALYPDSKRSEPNECRPGNRGRMNNKNNDVNVDFEVRVPRGVKFTGRTVNGSISASGLTADAEVSTVNGGIHVGTTGLATARTVNGDIEASMGRSDFESLDFGTVNGSIRVAMPEPLNTRVVASTVNGSIESDWPLTVSGKFGPKRVNGQIGSGGRELELSTVNGDIELVKRN